MKTTVKVRQIFRNVNSQMLLIENLFNDIEVNTNSEYVLELKKINAKRTLQQNKYFWGLVSEIVANSELYQDKEEIYISALEQAKAKYIYLMGIPQAEDHLRREFRAVKVVRPTVQNGKECLVFKCFIGSSQHNKEEFSLLLDIIIGWAEELGINTDPNYYNAVYSDEKHFTE